MIRSFLFARRIGESASMSSTMGYHGWFLHTGATIEPMWLVVVTLCSQHCAYILGSKGDWPLPCRLPQSFMVEGIESFGSGLQLQNLCSWVVSLDSNMSTSSGPHFCWMLWKTWGVSIQSEQSPITWDSLSPNESPWKVFGHQGDTV